MPVTFPVKDDLECEIFALYWSHSTIMRMRVVPGIWTWLILSACSTSPAGPGTSFRVIGEASIPVSQDLRRVDPAVVVIRDRATWADFVDRAGLRAPSGRPDDPVPPVDFSSEMSIVLLLGSRATSGYTIRVDQIAPRGMSMVVSATEIVSCAIVLPVVTYPLAAIAVNRTDRQVTVEWSRETCR